MQTNLFLKREGYIRVRVRFYYIFSIASKVFITFYIFFEEQYVNKEHQRVWFISLTFKEPSERHGAEFQEQHPRGDSYASPKTLVSQCHPHVHTCQRSLGYLASTHPQGRGTWTSPRSIARDRCAYDDPRSSTPSGGHFRRAPRSRDSSWASQGSTETKQRILSTDHARPIIHCAPICVPSTAPRRSVQHRSVPLRSVTRRTTNVNRRSDGRLPPVCRMDPFFAFSPPFPPARRGAFIGRRVLSRRKGDRRGRGVYTSPFRS